MFDFIVSMVSYFSNGDDYVIIWDMLLSGYEMYFVLMLVNYLDVCLFWCEDFNGLLLVYILMVEFDFLCDEGEVLY